MINSPIRRAAIAAAAIAALSFPAAAQSDPAFAAALGQTPSGLVTMAQLKTLSQRPAAAPAQEPAPDVWAKVFAVAIRRGKLSTAPNPLSGSLNDTYEVTEVIGDGNPFVTMHILRLTTLHGDTKPAAVALEVRAAHRVPGENFLRAVPWYFITDPSGHIVDTGYCEATLKPDGSWIMGDVKRPDGTTETGVKALLADEVNFWAAR